MNVFSELRRRNVIRVGTAYIVASWLIVQIVTTIFPAFGFDDSAVRLVIIVLLIGFIPALIFSWAYELTPDGLKPEHKINRDSSITPQTGKKLDRIIMVVLAIGMGFFAFDRFVLEPARDAALIEATTRQARSDAIAEAYAEKSIAVLPFKTESLDDESSIYIGAFVDELRDLLIAAPDLRVAADTSSNLVVQRDLNVAEIGALLNVSHVLTGDVTAGDGMLSISITLFNMAEVEDVWSAVFERRLEDLYGVQRLIVDTMLPEIGIRSEPVSRLNSVQPDVSSDAYKAFLRGNYFIKQHSVDGYARATELLQRAVELEPEYARGWARLAQAYVGTASFSAESVTRKSSWRRGRAAAEHALALEPDMADVWTVLAAGKLGLELDFGGADAAVQRALAINPDLEYANRIAGVSAGAFGRVEEAFEYSRNAVEVDPLSSKALMNAGIYAYHAGEYDLALDYGNHAMEINPSTVVIRQVMARAFAGKGEFQRALELIQEEPLEAYQHIGRALIHAESGDVSATSAALQVLIDGYSDYAALNIAEVYGFLDDRDLAFEWLQKAIELQDAGLMEARLLPGFEALRDDSRWTPFLAQAGLMARTD